tara:strand:- start:992 stop:1414 length:423 start_codon:yes stop_codon:yes gene_type:complete
MKKNIAINGKTYKQNRQIHAKLYHNHVDQANCFYEKWRKSNKPINADHKRAMDNLNRAYEDLRDGIHQLMLENRALNRNNKSWDSELWNDLYWSLPHNLYQFSDKTADLLNNNGYNNQCASISNLNFIRMCWRNKAKEVK